MKKILILLVCLCLSGCIVRNDDFEKTCTRTLNSDNLIDKTDIHVSYDNEDNINEAIVTKRYEVLGEDLTLLEDIKKSATILNEKYAFNNNIRITVSIDEDDVWEVKYYLDVPKISDNILEEFSLKKNSIKFFNKMRKENIECE